MMMLKRFRQLFRYDDWANREVLTSFRAVGTPPPRSLKLLGHILGTEYVWFSRIQQERSVLAVWPELSLSECEWHVGQLPELWSKYLNGLEEGKLGDAVTYKNSKGERWSNRVDDILMHVIMHSAYHRGQIASDTRQSGHTPAYTDFIHGVRQNLVG
ncbi:MAG TPA: DinB family protein [Terriglobales bacterium]